MDSQQNTPFRNNNNEGGDPSTASATGSSTLLPSFHSVHNPTDRPSHGPDLLQQAIEAVFTDWHGKTARPWQIDATKQVLLRHIGPSTPPSMLRPLLLVRSTGGGKSAVRDIGGILCGGITVTIVPLLSLAADQTSKLKHISLANHLSNRLQVFNLDVLRSGRLNNILRRHLENLPNDDPAKKRIFIFTSPQKISNDPSWQATIAQCCSNGTLRLVAIDECHLFATHGMEFREEFGALRKCFFKVLQKKTKVPIPVIFMTATASPPMLQDLSSLTGISFDFSNDLVWPFHHSGVERRNVLLDLSFKDSPTTRIKSELRKTCRLPGGRKLMVYSNSRKAITNLHEKSRVKLNHLNHRDGIQKDVLLVHGNMFREQKFHHTDIFVGKPLLDECPTTGRALQFDPVAYFATAGTASSGIDCGEVDKVIFHGIPASLQDLLQCSGRCGRSQRATPANSSFTIVMSLNSLVSIMTRIFIIPKYEESKKASQTATTTDNATSSPGTKVSAATTMPAHVLAERQWQNLLSVLSLLCLDNGKCIHSQLESMMLNPHHPSVCDIPLRCNGACWRCREKPISTALDCRVDIEALKQYFVRIFITDKVRPSQLSLHKDVFLNTLVDFETEDREGKKKKAFGRRVFRIKTKATIRQRAKATIMKCFASRILEPDVDGFQLRVKLGYDTNGNPRMNLPGAWDGFAIFPSKDS